MKKPFLSKGLSFYDENHQRISEESVKILLGWLDVATVVTEFARSNPATPKQEFDDNMVRADIDALFDAKHFNIAGFIIGEYCQENGQDLSINFSSYVDGQAISFVFKYEKNDVQLYKISYESNDFSSEPTKIEKSSFKEFESFCEKKYNETFVRIKNDVRNEILKDYPQYHGENLEKVLDRLTAKKIAAEHLMTPEISNIREDIGSLLDSIGRETDGMELE